MTECWSEGELRAYIDRELPPGDMERLAAHLSVCSRCEARFDEIAGRARWISEMIEALPEPAPSGRAMVPPRRVRRFRWAEVAGVAAAAALALILIPHHGNPPVQPAPVATAPAPKVEIKPLEAAPPPVETKPAIVKHPPSVRPHPRPRVDYFVALDNEPFQTGVIMRVALGSGDVQADVVYDPEGRPRAIRPVTK